MTISLNTVWEVRTTGADTNGGGFVAGSGGTDRSQSDTPFKNGTNLTVDSATNTDVLPDGYTPAAADVGNIIQITTTGTGAAFTTGFYQISSIQAGKWRLDRSPAAINSVGATWAMGGSLATFSKLASAMLSTGSNRAFIKGSYTHTATVTFSQSVTPGNAAPSSRISGYTTTRGDNGKATITLSTNTGLSGLKFTGNGWIIENIAVDCANLGTSKGIELATSAFSVVRDCKVSRFTSVGIELSNGTTPGCFRCEVTTGTSAATAGINCIATAGRIEGCNVHDNACPGITAGIQGMFVTDNLVTNNTGASSDGISILYSPTVLRNTVHGSGRDGINLTSLPIGERVRDNMLTGSGRYGMNRSSGAGKPASADYDGNAYWSNTSGNRNNLDDTTTNPVNGVAPYTNVLDVILIADPFVDKANSDFRLNATVGGGLAAKGFGVPQSWPGNALTTSKPDMGASQHTEVAAGGGGLVGAGALVSF